MSLKERQSNFELLRIFGILFIIIHHLSQHGLWFPINSEVSGSVIIHRFFYGYPGQLGNWIFILISGYFISDSIFSWKRVFRQWFQFFTISATIGVVLFVTKLPVLAPEYETLGFVNTVPIGIKQLIKAFMPTYFGINWFIVAYMVFYLFIPFLNPYLKSLERKTHFNLTLLMFILGTVIPFFPKQGFIGVDNIFNFMFGYFFANYIKLYNPKFFQNKIKNLVIFFTWTVLYFIAIAIASNIGRLIPCFRGYENRLVEIIRGRAVLTSVIPAVFLLCFFKNIYIKPNKLINILASTSLGVYLIHENPFFNKYLWHKIFRFDAWKESPCLILYMIGATFIVFICCAIIDLIRKNIIEKPLFKIIDKHWK